MSAMRESMCSRCQLTPWRARQGSAVGGFMGKPFSSADLQTLPIHPCGCEVGGELLQRCSMGNSG